MNINEEYNANDQLWYCGRRDKLDKFYKPSPDKQMFFTNDPHYALEYMDIGFSNRKDSVCVITTVNRFNLKIFDFSDINDVNKLEYPKDISKILVGDGFWQTTMKMHECCADATEFAYKNTSEQAKAWYREKFKALLDKNLDPRDGNEILYQFQAVILRDLVKLGYTAYYNFDYDDELSGAEALVLFDVDALDKVLPVQIYFEDMKELVDDIDCGKINQNDYQHIKEFIIACTGIDDNNI